MLQLAAPQKTASASEGSSPRGPSARYDGICDSPNATPPNAEPIIAPIRSLSSCAGAISASASAKRALVTASCENRSEEHTSELQSHSFISYAVFCLKKKFY